MKKLNYLAYLAIIPLITLTSCKALEKKLDKYLLEAQFKWGFDGAALVAVDGKVILSRGYGMANIEMGEPNTSGTVFFIGSITKQFTAAAILMLKEDGLLNLDDPISKHLPDYPIPGAEMITIHHLLSHSSGIPNYTDDPELLLKRTDMITPEQLISSFKNKPLEFEPGTGFAYSNSGYIVLGAIIESVSGQSYEAFLHRRIFKPLDMQNTGYARRESALPDRAAGYTLIENGRLMKAVPVDFSILHTAGALYSTVEDMLKWDQALYNNIILSDESIKLMITPQNENYGYGWFIEERFGRFHAFHGGFLDGYNTTFERWLDDRLCVIVFSNEDEAPVKKIARGLAAIIYSEPYILPVKKDAVSLGIDVLEEYVGVYQSSDGKYIYLELIDGELYISLFSNLMYHLYAEKSDQFFFANDNTELITFKRDNNNRILSLIYNHDQGQINAERLSPEEADEHIFNRSVVKLNPDIYDNYVGEYLLESNIDIGAEEFKLHVKRDDDILMAAPVTSTFMELYPSSETEFIHKVADFKIEFVVDNAGEVTGVIITMGGASIKGTKIK